MLTGVYHSHSPTLKMFLPFESVICPTGFNSVWFVQFPASDPVWAKHKCCTHRLPLFRLSVSMKSVDVALCCALASGKPIAACYLLGGMCSRNL